jgi:hypothetical protein
MSVQGDAREFDWTGSHEIKAIEEGIALLSSDSESKDAKPTPTTLAWHDHTLVIGPSQKMHSKSRSNTQLVCATKTESSAFVIAIPHLFTSLRPSLVGEVILELKARLLTGGQPCAVGAMASLRLCAARVAFWSAPSCADSPRPQPTLERDPTANRRLVAMSEAYPDVAAG